MNKGAQGSLIRLIDCTEKFIDLCKSLSSDNDLGLSTREIKALTMRLGLLDGKKYSWREIGKNIRPKHKEYYENLCISGQQAWFIAYKAACKLNILLKNTLQA